MADEVVVTFERKNYTWDGRRWYGTEDHMTPPFGMIYKLNALIPKELIPAVKKAPARRA